MAKTRMINTRLYSDNYVADLDALEKFLFVYLLTNQLTNISGIYEIPLKTIAFETGIDKDSVAKILLRFEEANKIKYFNGWIAVRNFLKNQSLNPKVCTGVIIEIKKAPKWTRSFINLTDEIKLKFKEFYGFDIEIDTCDSLSHPNSNSNSNSNPNSNYNQETPELKAFRIHYDSFKPKTALIYKQPSDNKLLNLLNSNSFEEIQNRLDFYFKNIQTDKHNVNHFISCFENCKDRKKVIENEPDYIRAERERNK